MTISTVQEAMIRIKGALPNSPIAVFRCNQEDKLHTVFAKTIRTQQQINAGVRGYIGSYHNHMDIRETKKILMRQVSEETAVYIQED